MTLSPLIFSIIVFAQTATLEMAPGDNNPTGNSLALSNVIRVRKNTNNPTNGNTFATFPPALTASFTLTNFEYGDYYTAAESATHTIIALGYAQAPEQILRTQRC